MSLSAAKYRATTTEGQIQSSIMRFLDAALPASYFAFHVPNGGKRDKIAAAILKREGVRAGVPDIIILRTGGTAAMLEVKKEGGKLSPHQRQFRDWCAENGFPFAVVRSVEDARETLAEWRIPMQVAQ